MEKRSAILSPGDPQDDVVKWINCKGLELHYEWNAQRVK